MPRRTTVSGACGSFKTLLANGKSGVYPRVASDLRLPGLTSIDGYTRSRDVRVRPLSFRVSAQTRAGSGCTSATTTCCVQAETEPSQTADHVVPLNEQHLKRLANGYVAYYHDD